MDENYAITGPWEFFGACAVLYVFLLIFLSVFNIGTKPLSRLYYVPIALICCTAIYQLSYSFLVAGNFWGVSSAWSFVGGLCWSLAMAYLSKRRSVDAFDTEKWAWLSIIPVVNLVLVFKGPVNSERYKQRSLKTRVVRWFSFACALFVSTLIFGFLMILVNQAQTQNAVSSMHFQQQDEARRVALILDDLDNSAEQNAQDYELAPQYTKVVDPQAQLDRQFATTNRDALATRLQQIRNQNAPAQNRELSLWLGTLENAELAADDNERSLAWMLAGGILLAGFLALTLIAYRLRVRPDRGLTALAGDGGVFEWWRVRAWLSTKIAIAASVLWVLWVIIRTGLEFEFLGMYLDRWSSSSFLANALLPTLLIGVVAAIFRKFEAAK